MGMKFCYVITTWNASQKNSQVTEFKKAYTDENEVKKFVQKLNDVTNAQLRHFNPDHKDIIEYQYETWELK